MPNNLTIQPIIAGLLPNTSGPAPAVSAPAPAPASSSTGIPTYPYVMGPTISPSSGLTIGGTLINPASGASAADIANARQAAVNELLQEQSQVKKTSLPGYGSNIRNQFYAGLEGLDMGSSTLSLYSVHRSGSRLGGLADDVEGLGDASLALTAVEGFLQGSGASTLKAGSFVGMLPVSLQNMINGATGQGSIVSDITGGVKQAQANVAKAQAAQAKIAATAPQVQPGNVNRTRQALVKDVTKPPASSGVSMGEVAIAGGIGLVLLVFLFRR